MRGELDSKDCHSVLTIHRISGLNPRYVEMNLENLIHLPQ
jgi:hypothetical protein